MFPPFSALSFTDLLLNGVKILFYIGFFFYVIFAFIALRQIDDMRKTVETTFSSAVLIIGILHLLLAIGLLVFVFTTLA